MLMHFPAVAVALTILLLIVTTIMVGRARARYGVKAPATTGNADFERVFRVQMNTLESVVAFLPALWLATAHQADPRVVAAFAGLWLVGRYWYAFAYASAANKRGPAFMLGSIGLFGLFGAGLWGLVRAMMV